MCAIGADDLVLLSVSKLKELREEIEALSNEASGVLTHALLMREKEVGDAETYNGMIQASWYYSASTSRSSPSPPLLRFAGSRHGGGKGQDELRTRERDTNEVKLRSMGAELRQVDTTK